MRNPIPDYLLSNAAGESLTYWNRKGKSRFETWSRFGISAVTARGDLNTLASSGSVVRSHAGAVSRLETNHDYLLRLKETLHRGEKMRIGWAAAELVQPNEVVIDCASGSTKKDNRRV